MCCETVRGVAKFPKLKITLLNLLYRTLPKWSRLLVMFQSLALPFHMKKTELTMLRNTVMVFPTKGLIHALAMQDTFDSV